MLFYFRKVNNESLFIIKQRKSGGPQAMNTEFLADRVLPASSADDAEETASPVQTELSKKTQFLHFLQRELAASKTETEKEAVRLILVRTKIQIHALEREWKQIQALGRNSSREPSPLATAMPQRLQ